MRKPIAILLLLCLFVTTFVGCGNQKPSETKEKDSTAKNNTEDVALNETASTDDGEMAKLTIAYCSGTIQPSKENLKRIENAVNEHTKKDLNMEVVLEMPDIGTHLMNIATELSAGAVSYDIMLVASPAIPQFASYGFLADITEPLNEYGQDLLNSYGNPLQVSCMSVNGRIYGVPVHKENSMQACIMMRKDLVDKYQIDTSTINSFEDMTRIYELVSSKEPDLLMIAMNSHGSDIGVPFDNFGSDLPFGLVNPTETTEIVSEVETEEFYSWVKLLHEWYQKGWIEQGVSSNQTADIPGYFSAGKAFSTIYSYTHPLAKADFEAQAGGTEIVMVPLGTQLATTKAASTFGFCVPAGTKDVNKSVQLLNYINTNKDVMNLLNWGEEGIDYVVTENGTLDYPDGISFENVGYHLDCGWALPNQLICTPWCTMEPDIYEQINEYNEKAVFSNGFGLTFDSSNVSTEVAAINQVVSQYYSPMITGELDPDEYIPVISEALKNAGCEKVMAEMQSQLDAYLTNK